MIDVDTPKRVRNPGRKAIAAELAGRVLYCDSVPYVAPPKPPKKPIDLEARALRSARRALAAGRPLNRAQCRALARAK